MLDEIVMTKQLEVEQAKGNLPFADLKAHLSSYMPERSFRKALDVPGKLSLIAEIKRKSPSKGMLRERFDPIRLGQEMEQAGAAALSVLTDEAYFGGRLEYLRDVKAFTGIPVLRKDFIVDPYQVYEAAFYQADAVLLIVRVLTDEQLFQCIQAADKLGIEPLVEVHSEQELKTALGAGAHIIGINHRDLRTFKVDTSLTEKLISKIPAGKIIVAESGLQSPEEVKRMKQLGVHAVLIGEALMTAANPAAKIKELFSQAW